MSHPLCGQYRKLPLILLALLALFIIPYPARSQAELIAHPNQDTTRNTSVASVYYEFQGKVFFNAFDQMGYALYCTDGTPAGTHCLTRDITPEAFTSCGDWLYIYGSKPQYDKIYDNPWGKFAIWRMKADGTERQKLVDLFRPYSMIYEEFRLWASQERVYYSWRGGLSWIDNVTGLVTEFYQGLRDTSSIREDYSVGLNAMARNGLFFLGQGKSKENFFFTDLFNHDAVPLVEIRTKGSAYPFDNMLIFNNKCYVLHVADTSQLWESDGTKAGTRKIWQNKTNFSSGSGNPFFSAFLEFQGKLIFDIPESQGDSTWHSLYTFDGSEVTLLRKHPNGFQNFTFVKSPDALFLFVRIDLDPQMTEVWKLDSSGYRQAGTLNSLTTFCRDAFWQDNLIILPTSGSLLFLDDRTLKPVYSIAKQCMTLYPASPGIFFNLYDNGYTRDPYVLQTSPPSCSLLRKMVWNFIYGSIEELCPAGNQLFFRANSTTTGRELWTTGGTAESSRMVKDIDTLPGNNNVRSTNPDALIEFRNRLVFTAKSFSTDYMDDYDFAGLWMTDGSDQGTVKIENLMIDENPPDNTKVIFRDRIWFIGKSKIYGDIWKLWASDGNPGEARLLDKDFQGVQFERPYGLTVAGDLLYFFAYTSIGSVKLWVTDGTEEGTRSIDDLIGNQNYSFSLYFTPQICAANGKLYFTWDRTTGNPYGNYSKTREVWVTDGTKSGSHCLADYSNNYSKDLYIKFLGIHQGNLVFTYSTPQDGLELWYSEGEHTTTRRLTGYLDTGSNPEKSFSGMASLGKQFFFTGYTVENGYELWVSDGTAGGTGIFMELAHGQQSTLPRGLTVIGDKMVFFCSGEGLSDHLWVTDGTIEGTEPLPWADTQLSNIHDVHYWQHALFFVASHPATGDGLYRYTLPGTLGTPPLITREDRPEMNVYPNPACDNINIDLGTGSKFPMTLKLINSNGVLVNEFMIRNNHATLPVKELPAGLYLIHNGESMHSFIKE